MPNANFLIPIAWFLKKEEDIQPHKRFRLTFKHKYMKNYFIYSYFSTPISTLAHFTQTKRHLTKERTF